MFDIEKKVKELRIYKNALMYNTHHKRYYLLKKYMEIEFFSGAIIRLDVLAGADITSCDYLQIVKKGRIVKTLFKNHLT